MAGVQLHTDLDESLSYSRPGPRMVPRQAALAGEIQIDPLGRDSDDVGMPGELDRGEDTAVAEPGDYDALSAHTGRVARPHSRAHQRTMASIAR